MPWHVNSDRMASLSIASVLAASLPRLIDRSIRQLSANSPTQRAMHSTRNGFFRPRWTCHVSLDVGSGFYHWPNHRLRRRHDAQQLADWRVTRAGGAEIAAALTIELANTGLVPSGCSAAKRKPSVRLSNFGFNGFRMSVDGSRSLKSQLSANPQRPTISS
jgi:hypothetical protein